MLMLHDNIGRTNWVTHIKDLLFQYGYGYVRIRIGVGHINRFVSSLKQRLDECLTRNWSDKFFKM